MDLKDRWSSRKLWTVIATTTVGIAVTLLQPSLATVPFYGFLVAMCATYLAGNLGEYKLRSPFLESEDTSDE